MPKSKANSKSHVSESEDNLSFSESENEHHDTVQTHNVDNSESSNTESDNEDVIHEAVNESENEEKVTKSKGKVTTHDIINMLEKVHNQLNELGSEFKEKTQVFKNLEKEYLNTKKELDKRQQILLKRLGRTISVRTKSAKKRDPNTIGGFNKRTQVPTSICSYLNLDEDSQILSRPEVVALLKTKFEEEGHVDSETKEIKIPNKQLKKFGIPKNYVFKGNRYQSFLKLIYDNFKGQTMNT